MRDSILQSFWAAHTASVAKIVRAGVLTLCIFVNETSGQAAGSAQLMRFRGQTVDSLGRRVAGVSLRIPTISRETESDSLGEFLFDSVPAGVVTMQVAHSRFQSLTLSVPLAIGDTAVVPILLTAADDSPTVPVEPNMLYGFVSDARGRPIDGAEVLLASTGQETRTDSLGRFVILNVPATQHLVRVRKIGFFVQYVPLQSKAGGTVRAKVVLDPMGTALGGVIVRADRIPVRLRRFRERALRNANGQFMLREQFVALEIPRLMDVLERMRGVTIRLGEFGREIVTGRNNCTMTIMLDGEPLDLANIGLTALVTLQDIAGVEVYLDGDGVPPELRFRGCGLIGLWTR